MSTKHGQPGLSSDQRSTIRSTILSTRHTLEDELRRQLEKYGIYEDKRLPLENLTHLSVEEIHTRRTLDAAIERELESTEGDLERSITNYVREATKTYLNRFVALKTIEVRGLVEETITERPEYGNRSYMHHTVAEIAGELTNAPDDGFSAALDLAYQEIGAEIRMIFEESEHTAIELDAQVREEVLDELDAIDDEAWVSDEALGWVYQYFGEEEREDIDERVDEENYKIAGTDIATKTQLFTPRYIVEWMVDNSLGRIWLEMRGDATEIDDEDNCFYLAPLEDSFLDREEKPVETITVLDPACGSGHMLFYAFEVLYQMYLEEGKVPEAYIPRKILQNNLYGIDIDSGAAQIAALSLYLKAKEHSPDVTIPQMNIVSADAVLINGDRKQEVLNRARSEVEAEVLEQIWQHFDNIREWGSLVQIEDRIDEILDEHREELEPSGQAKFTEGGGFQSQSTFVTDQGQKETWDEVKAHLLEAISKLASEALERNEPIEEMFAGEVEKSVELLDVLRGDYDVVVSNPPYLQSAKMGETLKQFIRDHYTGKYDVYAAFIERCLLFAEEDGHVSMVTPENFMFLYYFRGLRKKLINECYFLEAAHLSGHSFSMKDRPFTIPYVIRNTPPTEDSPSRFHRLTHEQSEYDTHLKTIRGLADVTKTARLSESHPDSYVINQTKFDKIGRRPFLYWFGDSILSLFDEYPKLSDLTEVAEGLGSGDDEKFVRDWWEIDQKQIGDKYRWLMKSGESVPYYYSTTKTILWNSENGDVRDYNNSNIRNEDLQGLPGVTFRNFGKHFTARLHQEGHLFNNKSPFVHVDDQEQRYETLAYLNSTLVRFIMNGLNPGINFNTGDGKRLPIKKTHERASELTRLADLATERRRYLTSLNEIHREFDGGNLIGDFEDILFSIDMAEADVEVIHREIDRIVFEEYGIKDGEEREKIYSDLPKNLSKYPHLNDVEKWGQKSVYEAEVPAIEVDNEEYQELVTAVESKSDQSLREISEELEISPYSVATIRKEHNIYGKDEKKNLGGQLLSYFIGCAFNRWEDQNLTAIQSEILCFGERQDKNVREVVDNYLDELFESSSKEKRKIDELLGEDAFEWLRHDYFENHHCKEYRRRGQRIPIYWQLESPDGAFSCFVYYHEIDANTLPKLRGQYLDPRIGELENELETLGAQTSGDDPDKELLNRKEEVQNDLEDIREFRDTIDEMIDDGITIDFEKGIWENIKEWDQYEVLETGLPKLKSSYSR